MRYPRTFFLLSLISFIPIPAEGVVSLAPGEATDGRHHEVCGSDSRTCTVHNCDTIGTTKFCLLKDESRPLPIICSESQQASASQSPTSHG